VAIRTSQYGDPTTRTASSSKLYNAITTPSTTSANSLDLPPYQLKRIIFPA
jgi:hypothetical protein